MNWTPEQITALAGLVAAIAALVKAFKGEGKVEEQSRQIRDINSRLDGHGQMITDNARALPPGSASG